MSSTNRSEIDSGKLDWIWAGDLKERHGYTESDLITLAHVLSRACPHCGAAAGGWCLTGSGTVLDHLDRQHVARRSLGRTEI